MAKTKKQTENKKEVSFNLEEALNGVNPFLKEGFHKFLLDKDVNTLNDFKKLYKIYAGDEL